MIVFRAALLAVLFGSLFQLVEWYGPSTGKTTIVATEPTVVQPWTVIHKTSENYPTRKDLTGVESGGIIEGVPPYGKPFR